jgi:hypothetical protein
MITTVAVDGGLGLAAELPPGAVAYVDRDWVPAEAGAPVPAIVVDGEHGAVRFGDGEQTLSRGDDAHEVAARALLEVAREAAAVVGDARPAEVSGAGAVAWLAAEILGVEPARTDGRPAAVVEATGDPEAIATAAARLADLGTIVLVGEALGRRARLNLYPDVHSRGLRIVGIRPPLAARRRERDGNDDVLTRLPAATEAEPGAALDREASWYRVA